MQPPEGVPHRLPEHGGHPKVTELACSFSVALFILQDYVISNSVYV